MPDLNIIDDRTGSVTDDDRYRAQAAAEASLAAAGWTAEAAYAAFVAEWAYLETDEAIDAGRFQDYDDMREPGSLAWIDAEKAADCALTEGWANPEGASCGISA